MRTLGQQECIHVHFNQINWDMYMSVECQDTQRRYAKVGIRALCEHMKASAEQNTNTYDSSSAQSQQNV